MAFNAETPTPAIEPTLTVVGYVNEMGEAVLLPQRRKWMHRDNEYERALRVAMECYESDLLYAKRTP